MSVVCGARCLVIEGYLPAPSIIESSCSNHKDASPCTSVLTVPNGLIPPPALPLLLALSAPVPLVDGFNTTRNITINWGHDSRLGT